MASAAKRTSELPVRTSLTANDRVVVLANTAGTPNTYTITLENLLGNSSASVVLANSAVLSANTVRIRGSATPANSTSTTVTEGTIWWDSSFIYVATANNTVKRAALSTF